MLLLKYHALGNDYLVVADPAPAGMAPALARALCDRHCGAGSDGILLWMASDRADFRVRIYNPDGSEAEKSGNGLRILARYLRDRRGAPPRFSVETAGGVVGCAVEGEQIEVEMGAARVSPIPPGALDLPPEVEAAFAVDVGNPHCALFTRAELDALPWREWGARLERHPRFPNRTNVQLARALSPGVIELRIWERGAGETRASGSSACAVSAAAAACGLAQPGWIEARMPGGALQVDVGPELQLTLRGSAEPVAEIFMDERWLTRTLIGPPRAD